MSEISILPEIAEGERDFGDLGPEEIEELKDEIRDLRKYINGHIESIRELDQELSRQSQILEETPATEAERWQDGFTDMVRRWARVSDALTSGDESQDRA